MAHRVRSAWLGLAACVMLATLVGCTGDTGPAGPAGPAGADGAEGPAGPAGTDNPSVSAITPNRAFLERRSQVTISGYGTEWTTAPTVSFDGGGVTVDNVQVASPTSLVVDITVADNALVGTRNVVVGEGETAVTYEDAFNIESPILLDALGGTTAQGSIILVGGKMVDLSTPFDTLLLDSEYFSLQVGDSSPWQMGDGDASTYSFFNLAFVDVLATSGPTDLVISNGVGPNAIVSRAQAAVDVAARMPTALTVGAQIMENVTNGLESKLYTITTNPDVSTVVWVTADNADAAPAFALLPDTGRFADMIEFGSSVTLPSDPAPQTYYLVYWDNTGTAGYGITVEAQEIVGDETEPNNTCNMAQDAGAPPVSLANLSLLDEMDEDWFAIDVPSAAVGGTIHAWTSPGDDNTDTWIEILGDDCVTSYGMSSDLDYHEDLTSAPIPAAGIYYVRVFHSSYPYAGTFYNLDIELNIPMPADVYEPNDDYTMATPAMSGTTLQATISPTGDLDYFSVMANAGQTIHAVVSDGATNICTDGSIDTVVDILDMDGMTSLASNDDSIPGSNYCSDVSFMVPAAGTYFVQVAPYSANASFDYAVTVTVQ